MSRNSDYFKKIQLSLFDFFNHKPIEKFKGKDLLGPLKYLNDDPIEQTVLERNNFENTGQNKSLVPNHTLNQSNTSSLFQKKMTDLNPDSENTIFGMALQIHRKPYMRHLRFSVKPNGTVYVIAPLNRPFAQIQKELTEHKDWILKCNLGFQKVRDLFPSKRFVTGEIFPLLGEAFTLKLTSSDFKKPFLQLDLDQLQFFYPEKWDLLQKKEKEVLLKKYLTDFYQTHAITHLNQRVRVLSEAVKLFPKKIGFRNQKTRWGSCSSDSSITLNWKLVAFDQELVDYVIIHELCHIQHANHSKRFWTLVETHCPDYKRLNKQLNQSQFLVDFLAPESELYLSNPSLV